jgi:transketolase
VLFSRDGFTTFREDGEDVLLLSSGFVLDRVIEAGRMLKEVGIKPTVADVNILYAKDNAALTGLVSRFDRIVTVEDHNVNGGLGSYIAALVCENRPARVKRIGLRSFGESGPAKELADKYGFSPEKICQKTKEFLK